SDLVTEAAALHRSRSSRCAAAAVSSHSTFTPAASPASRRTSERSRCEAPETSMDRARNSGELATPAPLAPRTAAAIPSDAHRGMRWRGGTPFGFRGRVSEAGSADGEIELPHKVHLRLQSGPVTLADPALDQTDQLHHVRRPGPRRRDDEVRVLGRDGGPAYRGALQTEI